MSVAVAITATVQDVWPPRILITLTGLIVGDGIQLYREVDGVRTAVRAGWSSAVTDTSFARVDAELPFGVPVSYVADVSGVEYATAAVTHVLPGGKVALTDAITGHAAEVVILAWPDRTFDRKSTTYQVGGRNVVVAGELVQPTGAVELFVETTSARDNLAALLRDATEATVQVRQPGGYDGVDSYLSVTRLVERRWSQDGTDQRRVFALDVSEVEGWAPTLEASGYSLQDLADVYLGLTLADLAGDYATLLTLAQAELGV